jgi:hypothetical protein
VKVILDIVIHSKSDETYSNVTKLFLQIDNTMSRTKKRSSSTEKINQTNQLINLLVIHGEYTSWRSPHQIETHQTYIRQATILHLKVEISKPGLEQNVLLCKDRLTGAIIKHKST